MGCMHRWTVIKRWDESGIFYVIQRCRRCDTWKKRGVDALSDGKPTVTTEMIDEQKTDN